MSDMSNAPIIIKRKKVVSGGGHHGGAWKVAYADFVTAMMAFFMMMWLLNATTEQQRTGIADYFKPTIAITNTSGGGDGALGGEDIRSARTMPESESGGLATQQGDAAVTATDAETAAETQALRDLEAALMGLGGETMLDDNIMRHVVTRLTDEGLVIELFDIEGAPLFIGDTAEPTPLTREIAALLSRVLGTVRNDLALAGHVRTESILRIDYPVWDLSTDRASAMRELLLDRGTPSQQIVRQAGHADKSPSAPDPRDLRNNRVELVVLRSDR